MSSIKIGAFSGERPAIASRLLGETDASLAQNCKLESGDLEPLYGALVQSDYELVSSPSSLFLYDRSHWFSWSSDVDAINSPIHSDDYKRVYYTGDGAPKVTDSAIASGSGPMPDAYYTLGVPAPESAPSAAFTNVTSEDDATDDETRYYVYTYVTNKGEEGPPCSPGDALELEGSPEVTLTFDSLANNTYDIAYRRIYRTATGESSTEFLYVADVPLATLTYTDALTVDELGSAIETEYYDPPPETLQGLCLLAGGFCAGFTDNEVMFSEAYLPYAWPTSYSQTCEHSIVGVKSLGNSLVVGTEGYPYFFSGYTPDSVTGSKIDLPQACVSKRGMLALPNMVIYPSPDGLVAITEDGGASLITQGIVTRRQWQAMSPSSLSAFVYEGAYVGISDTHSFLFRPQTKDFLTLSLTDYSAGYCDLLTDTLYLTGDSLGIHAFDSDSANHQTYIWRSKVYQTKGESWGWASVVREGAGSLTFRLIVDESTVFELDNPDTDFRLPVVFGRNWQIELEGSDTVNSVSVAGSAGELL